MTQAQFLIAGPPDLIGPLNQILRSLPEVTVQPSPSSPDRLVVVMDAGRAEALRLALIPVIQLEPDLPLSFLLGGAS